MNSVLFASLPDLTKAHFQYMIHFDRHPWELIWQAFESSVIIKNLGTPKQLLLIFSSFGFILVSSNTVIWVMLSLCCLSRFHTKQINNKLHSNSTCFTWHWLECDLFFLASLTFIPMVVMLSDYLASHAHFLNITIQNSGAGHKRCWQNRFVAVEEECFWADMTQDNWRTIT